MTECWLKLPSSAISLRARFSSQWLPAWCHRRPSGSPCAASQLPPMNSAAASEVPWLLSWAMA